ncbi:MAG: hypothetical protein ACOCUU_00935 [Nanoarchaeota archaeon]
MNKTISIIGIVILILAATSYIYYETERQEYFGGFVEDTDISHPYREYTFPLFVGGLVLLIVGILINQELIKNIK